MSTKQEREAVQRRDREDVRREAQRAEEGGLLEDVVADRVMSALGRPGDFLRVAARRVSGGCYRVNVFTGPHAASARVAHSYFVEADGDGRVLACSPPLSRLYGAAQTA